MQKGPSPVSSGNITPVISGPQKEKDVFVLAGLVLFLAGLTGTAWYFSQSQDQPGITASSEKIESANVSEMLRKAGALNQAEASTTNTTPATAPLAGLSDIVHTDVYFEVGRKALTDEGKAQLSAQADMLKQHQDYAVLIQGYTDQQGSANYNKKLGLKRAETVKGELLNAGVAEYRIAVVSLGEEGVLCIDSSDICRHLNRRAHLEIRKIGQEHMALPVMTSKTGIDSSEAGVGSTNKTEMALSQDQRSSNSTDADFAAGEDAVSTSLH
jgi:peptidoglycan-associated lipoprotein